jgi:HD-GYP domain-containing protein (c-di-GMP phosphodiesterase class II)
MYMAVQYAFVGIAQTKKAKINATTNNSNPHEEDGQAPVFLLEAMPVYNESEGIDTACEAETAEEISETEVIEEAYMAETGELAKDNHVSVTYQQGIDDFYQSQAESQKKKLDTIHEYLLYIMSPFVYEEDMDEFCTDLLRFAMDHNYRPEVEWKRYKTKLSSFDVRHMVWSIATRLGLGKGKVYSNDDCACYIERRFASLCITACGEPLSHNTLRNLTVTSNSDQIHCDYPGKDGLLFHIPLQLGGEKG